MSDEQRRQPGCPARELCCESRGRDTRGAGGVDIAQQRIDRGAAARGLGACPSTWTEARTHVLFDLPPRDVRGVAPSPDGNTFYLLLPVGENPSSLTVVQNWATQLEKHE